MKEIKQIMAALLIMSLTHTTGQVGKVKRADNDYENYALMDAIASYEELANRGYSDEEIFRKLGDAHYLNAQYKSAALWYGKLMELEGEETDPEYLFRYAQAMKSVGDYQGSDRWMDTLRSKVPSDQRAKNFNDQKDYLERIGKNSGRYTLNKININSAASDFAPSYFQDLLIFSTARDTGITSRNIHRWNNGTFLNLYSTRMSENGQFQEPKKFAKILNTKAHESSSVFTADGNTVYFTRNNSKDGNFARDPEGISRLMIFKSTFEDGRWTKAVKLPFNSDRYSVAHPALSHDEKTLFFSSDMPGSLGASDIFKVAIKEDGSYGSPEHLGNGVNTEAREGFPFVFNDVLYFSSDGHPGLGGLDIFATQIDEPGKEVINVGEPVNGRQDDFSYIIDASGQGYFASNREGGLGSDDIYSFIQTKALQFECIAIVKGMAVDRKTLDPLSAAKVTIIKEDTIITETGTDLNGRFELAIDCNEKNYSLAVHLEGYASNVIDLAIEGNKPGEVILQLERIRLPKATGGTNLIEYLLLKPVHFDLDSSSIRPDAQQTLDGVASYLNEYPDLKFSIESHTDAKGSSSYNQRLSERRAKATFDYLLSKGIKRGRMSLKGFGENHLVNSCSVWAECPPEENEKNRRSEIIVLE